MSTSETGGPAFPVVSGCGRDTGITMRDYFAAKFISGASYGVDPKIIAERAYEFADAMLSARDK